MDYSTLLDFQTGCYEYSRPLHSILVPTSSCRPHQIRSRVIDPDWLLMLVVAISCLLGTFVKCLVLSIF